METPKIVNSSGVLTLTPENLRKLIAPADVDWMDQQIFREHQLKHERDSIHVRMNRLLDHINALEKETLDSMGEQEFDTLDTVHDALSLRYQRLVGRLIRVVEQLARNKRDMRRKQSDLYDNFVQRGLL